MTDRPVSHMRSRPRRRKVSVVGVAGELLLTIAVAILLFIGWKLWWNDAIMAEQQAGAATERSRDWSEAGANSASDEEPLAGPPIQAGDYVEGEPLAVMYVPRFNSPGTTDSVRTIAEGYGLDVLNSFKFGIGHYPTTQMPGEVGNFAIASHRSAYGGGMREIEQLRLGDAIYIQTESAWFTYRFRDFEYVPPAAVDVLAPVPHHPELQPSERIITLTTCNPLYSTAERIIAYGVLDHWQPLSAGPPAEITADVANWGQ